MISSVITYLVGIIDLITIAIIFFWFCYALFLFLEYHVRALFGEIVFGSVVRYVSLHRIRVTLGEYLLLALEFYICADIISSIQYISNEHLIHLAIIVVIRIVISFFLQREIVHLNDKEGGSVLV